MIDAARGMSGLATTLLTNRWTADLVPNIAHFLYGGTYPTAGL